MTSAGELRPNLRWRPGGRKSVPSVLQMESTECAAACLGMILAHFGCWVPLEVLRDRCEVSRNGANAANMLRTAYEYGLVVQEYQSDSRGLAEIPFPMVLLWENNHFVVLTGIRGKRAFINDPSEGPRDVSIDELEKHYEGACFGFRPGSDFRRKGRPPGALRSLAGRIGRSWTGLIYLALTALALIVPGIAVPTLIKVFIDDVLIGQNGAWVGPLLMGFALAAVAQGALIGMQRLLLARMETKLSIVMSARFLWHVATLPIGFFSRRFAGDIAGRVRSNNRVARLIAGELAVSFIGFLSMAAFGLVMLWYDVLLTMVVFALVGVNVITLRFAARAAENPNRRLTRERARLDGISVSGLKLIETLKANGAEGDFLARLSGVQANSLTAQQRLGLVTALASIVPPLVSLLSMAAILGIGGIRILDGSLTVGGLIAFQSLALSFSAPVAGIVRFSANLQTIKGDIALLDDVENHAPDERTLHGIRGQEPDSGSSAARGRIELEGISFGYNATEPPLIEEFSLSVSPGRRVALVGGSGSGKSTIARLVCGLLVPWSGNVRIDGQDLPDIPPSRVAEIVAHVDQDTKLFEGTVRENVTLWNPAVKERDIAQALRDAAVHEVVSSRPRQTDSSVDEGGRNFSGGQRQRLEIARALVRNPAILVLDEATEALDPVTELAIDEHLRRRGCTCVIVANRLSTLRDADEIVVLERGRIVQRGTHEGLLAEGGAYRELVCEG